MGTTRKYSLGLFAAALLLFFFPFVTVSCNGVPIGSLTGVQLAIGADPAPPDQVGDAGPAAAAAAELVPDEAAPQPMALLALVATVAGLGAAVFLRGTAAAKAGFLAGMTGAMSLVGLQQSVGGDIREGAAKVASQLGQNGGIIITFQFTELFWLTLMVLAAAGVLNYMNWDVSPPYSPPGAAPSPGGGHAPTAEPAGAPGGSGTTGTGAP
ncbi:MAG TPA: hypothetical protein VFQ45_06825 [Longimicrobium sp.]|nr:hypothetical protein [Longimicrobium sp.]